MSRIATALISCALACVCFLSVSPAKAATETVIYSFCQKEPDCADGDYPDAGVIDVKGRIYGTTSPQTYPNCTNSCGTVFRLDPSTGSEKVLHAFQTKGDGYGPLASLIDVQGTLYGTTVGGGSNCAPYGCGTVFSVNRKTGAETVLYSLCSQANCSDGDEPHASLLDVNGMLYGTTAFGGATNSYCSAGCGTAFSLNPATGVETVLYSFCSQKYCADGLSPGAGLINVNGMFYGTTAAGGAHDGAGTVFSLNPTTGAETVLYSFCSQTYCADGAAPIAGLINVSGTLYGTTLFGGNNDENNCSKGCGVMFSLDPATGKETTLYAFCSQTNCTDGTNPASGLIKVKGTLYGTTAYGGVAYCARGPGCGTVFSFDLSTGTETSVYSFCSQTRCADGALPVAGLINVKGTLYGTTSGGGAKGFGTVFSLVP